jgi:hypothetical protein
MPRTQTQTTQQSSPTSGRPDLVETAAKATEDTHQFFDAGKPPPFRIGDIRATIPSHCWRKSPWRSLSYVVRDVAVVAALAVAAAALDSWAVWPLYWAAQGTMFWALFVLGHDWYTSLCLWDRHIVDCSRIDAKHMQSIKVLQFLFLPFYFVAKITQLIFAVVTGASLTTGPSTAWWASSCTPSSSFPTMDGTYVTT